MSKSDTDNITIFTKTCSKCGKNFLSEKQRARVCPDCSTHNAEYHKQYRKAEREQERAQREFSKKVEYIQKAKAYTGETIPEYNARARANGMTYGQLSAKEYALFLSQQMHAERLDRENRKFFS